MVSGMVSSVFNLCASPLPSYIRSANDAGNNILMLVIRLQPTGRKNQKKFRLILQERTQAPKAKAQEILGSYDPHLKDRKDQIVLKTERIQYWIGLGAQPSNTVHNMLIEFGVIEGDKRRSVFNKKAEPEAVAEEAAPTEEKPASEEAPAAEEKKEDAKVE